jgi:hypothetical protein
MKLAAWLAALCVAIPGCQRDRPGAPGGPGQERGACRPDRTCDPGLLCLSSLCVRPPAADCKDVADQLASLELGNYAEPEDRAPVVDRYAAACDKAMVSKDEGNCIAKARDPWTAQRCVPRMFPDAGTSSTDDCATVISRTKLIMEQQSPYLTDPASRKWFDLSMTVMQQSCEQDRWPDAVKKCVLAANLSPAKLTTCNTQLPPALQESMKQRLAKAMEELRGR